MPQWSIKCTKPNILYARTAVIISSSAAKRVGFAISYAKLKVRWRPFKTNPSQSTIIDCGLGCHLKQNEATNNSHTDHGNLLSHFHYRKIQNETKTRFCGWKVLFRENQLTYNLTISSTAVHSAPGPRKNGSGCSESRRPTNLTVTTKLMVTYCLLKSTSTTIFFVVNPGLRSSSLGLQHSGHQNNPVYHPQ